MHRIKVEDLYPEELRVLEFSIDFYAEEEKQFIYDNLFRDEEGVAHYPSRNRKKLLAIFTD